jgi:hypothetical protein
MSSLLLYPFVYITLPIPRRYFKNPNRLNFFPLYSQAARNKQAAMSVQLQL